MSPNPETSKAKRLVLSMLAVFLLALLPRIAGLGGFLTTDERFWVESSRDFLGGLMSSEFACPGKTEHKGQSVLEAGQGFACTLRAGHPGVVTMWGGSLGLWLYYLNANQTQPLLEFIAAMSVNPADAAIIPWVRLPIAVLTSLAVVVTFLMLNKLLETDPQWGYAVALLAALVMALSPYEIALSRILHTDGLETAFLTLSLLAGFHYWGNCAARRWLLLSGVLAGLSFLAKSPALFLIPFAGLLAIWALGKQLLTAKGEPYRLKIFTTFRVAGDGLVWLMTAVLVYILFWPALWVIPAGVIDYVFGVVFGYATVLDDKGIFFLGDLTYDPGLFFYPISWLFQTTPFAVVGSVLTLVFWLRGFRQSKWVLRRLGYSSDDPISRLFFLSLLFVITFFIFLSVSDTKQKRYLLPVYPFLDIIAAIGWVWLAEYLIPLIQSRYRLNLDRLRFVSGLVVVVVVLNGLLVSLNFPYYFTYYNPLFGGIRVAQQYIPVGWGEGLDVVAAYLNEKPRAEQLTVASWYGSSSFAPFFTGQVLDFYQQKGNVLAGDYVVIYVDQWQRQIPDSQLYTFLDNFAEPEKTFFISGIPYARIYPGLGLDHHLEYQRYHGVAELLGWEYTTSGINPDHPVLKPGEQLDFDLWWEYLGKPSEEVFFLWLVGSDSRIWAETITRPRPDAGDPADWSKGKIVPESGSLVVPPGTPPGDYTIHIGFYPETPDNPDQVLFFDLGDNPRAVTVLKEIDATLPLSVEPRNIDASPLSLLGQQIDQTEMIPDIRFDVELYWQALEDISTHYQMSLALVDETGETRWEWERVDPVAFYPTENWQENEIVRSQMDISPSVQTPGGDYQLVLNIYDNNQQFQTIPLTLVQVQGRERQFALPETVDPVEVRFEGGITLLGYQTDAGKVYQPGDEVAINLFWQPQNLMDDDYTVFVQLLDPIGQVYGQVDAQPQSGEAPTSHWTPGEIVKDMYKLTVAENGPPGQYKLITGLYLFETGERLIVNSDKATFVELLSLEISE